MKGHVTIVARPAVATGLALTGLPVREATSPAEAEQAVRALVDDPSAGVVLIEDEVHAALPEEFRRQVARRPVPLLVPFPGPEWERLAPSPESYIVELLRQVIGYRVRLR